MALFEKCGVRYELTNDDLIAAFINNGWKEVTGQAAEVDSASAVSASTAKKQTVTKSVARRRRIQNKEK